MFLSGWNERYATPEEMGYPLVFLRSKMAGYVSGQDLMIDYGLSATLEIQALNKMIKTRKGIDVMSDNSYFSGRIIRTNLSTASITKEQFNERDLRKYIGGNGFGIKILYDEIDPAIEPMDPENKIIFSAGPLNGTSIPGSGTMSVVTKGPMTRGLASAQSNGFFGARMRQAGVDILIVEGAAKDWQYLYIHDGEAELRDATHLLGKDVVETQNILREEIGYKKASVATIGPAGENLIPFACVSNDYGHVASTNGCGAVMGSKKLKAIVVYAEKNRINLYDPDGLKEIARGAIIKEAGESVIGELIKNNGTYAYFNLMFPNGQAACKNYTTNVWPTMEKYFGENLHAAMDRKKRPCWACPWGHCAEVTVKEGRMAGYTGEELEFEALSAFTINIGNDDISIGTYLGNINEQLGMDVKELAFTISLVFECYEKGLITAEDTGGMEFNWGQTKDVEQLIRDIAFRRRFGKILADGVKRAAERIGKDAPNMAVWSGRGIAPHVIDARGSWNNVICQASSDNGSFYGPVFGSDEDIGVLEEDIGLFDVDKIPSNYKRTSDRFATKDALGVCFFFTSGKLQPVLDALRLATGWDISKEELLAAGERIRALSRAFNIRCGMDPEKDNKPSPRFAMPPVDGPAQGEDINKHYDKMLLEYYRASQWDEKSSKPLPETLKRLDLEYVIKDLWS